MELRIGVAACQLATADAAASNIYKKQFLVNCGSQPAETIVLNRAPLQQKLVLLVAPLRYFFADGSKETRPAFMPASVVRAAYF